MRTILLIEDNIKILATNKEFFEKEGYIVFTASTLAEGSDILKRELIQLIILDIMLPDGSGIDFCAEIRKTHNIPVLYLTCVDEDDSLVSALKAGGDEYMTKPYSLNVLSARVMALLRRVSLERSAPERFTVGALEIDCEKRIMFMNGRDLQLKPKEFDLLLVLVRGMGRKFTAEELYSRIWSGIPVDMRTVTVHISTLRRKLESSKFFIVTENRRYYSLIME
ncbi:MAG: response regulator transcription factor [Oscillospiraceae bacterium]|nr:response regulator transcription factor [Oscillospiraceae bacterium]